MVCGAWLVFQQRVSTRRLFIGGKWRIYQKHYRTCSPVPVNPPTFFFCSLTYKGVAKTYLTGSPRGSHLPPENVIPMET